MFDKVVAEMRSKPFTMILLLGLWGVVAMLWASRADYAMAGDLATLKMQVAQVEGSIQRASLETQLRAINTEMFAIQQKITDLRAAGKQPDQIYWDRLSGLSTDKERLTRELAVLK